jgi:hypothetical protein
VAITVVAVMGVENLPTRYGRKLRIVGPYVATASTSMTAVNVRQKM